MRCPFQLVAISHMTRRHPHIQVMSLLLAGQALVEKKYDARGVIQALQAHNGDPSGAERFLEARAQLCQMGFPDARVCRALVEASSDAVQAATLLTEAGNGDA